MAGVMPEPAVTNSRWLWVGVAGLSSSVKSPCAWLRWSIWPGRASVTRNRETWPSSWARTVSVMRSPGIEAAEETVKQRVTRLAEPGRSTPTCTYWPARCPRQVAVGCRVRVATGAASLPGFSRWTSTTRARTSVAAHIGLTSSR